MRDRRPTYGRSVGHAREKCARRRRSGAKRLIGPAWGGWTGSTRRGADLRLRGAVGLKGVE